MGAQRAVQAHERVVDPALDSSDQVMISPRLELDLGVVEAAHRTFRDALPESETAYAVKANPHPAVLALLAEQGASVDLASRGELDACLLAGVPPERMSWGNPLKKPSDVRAAVAAGVHRFTTDAASDVDLLARLAPGADVTVRLGADDTGSATPFSGKFGVAPDEAADLLRRARDAGLRPHGLGFHPGSQQTDPASWRRGIAAAARAVESFGAPVAELNVGGGFPTPHAAGPVPDLSGCADAIRAALAEHADVPGVGSWRPHLVAEPGRALVAEAGVLVAEVVLVTERAGRRWVYLDVGRYQGLAETEGEMIVYRLRTPGYPTAAPSGHVVLAGPTCDGDDVLYRHADVRLPLDLAAGDTVEFLGAGAYTSSYASVGFNGLPPLPTVIRDRATDDTPEETD
ncbi:type III PLP-dependent enzyme [Actinomycetospora endophytica]|uniref:ornithine decarboxylase n=1 Tax=Actinomycetospora endophytica TaxID=2291215 RepID=A0ABS8P973_9PSEU|nr:type III PLP-dependent enzyme [Actinomycetospora endophytica]MCD2194482.1 type III PLP-dependent enzyme [Actinomycetospora endophytica]